MRSILSLDKPVSIAHVRRQCIEYCVSIFNHLFVDKCPIAPVPEITHKTTVFVLLLNIELHIDDPVALTDQFLQVFLRFSSPGLLSQFRGVDTNQPDALDLERKTGEAFNLYADYVAIVNFGNHV